MELVEAMRSTPATRYFLSDPVPDEVLYRVLDNARFAASGGNRQGWHVLVVRDAAQRAAIAEIYKRCWAEYSRGMTLSEAVQHFAAHYAETPVLLVVCAEIAALARVDANLDRPSIVGGASVYTFVQNVLLGCRNEGLGAALTTIAIPAEPELRQLLAVPDGVAIAAMVPIGWPDPARQLRRLTRKPVEEFTSIDRYGGKPLRP